MAKTVKINNVTHESVPQVSIPLSSGTGNANYYETTGATATASDILQGKTAFLNAGQSTGSMPNNGAIAGKINKKDGIYTVAAGYHDGKGTVQISETEQAKLVSENIKAGSTILGVSGKTSVVDTSDATGTSGTILSDSTAYVNGAKITGTLTTAKITQDSTSKVLTIK